MNPATLDITTEDGNVHVYPAWGGGAYITVATQNKPGGRGCSLSADNIVEMIAALARVLRYVAANDDAPPTRPEAKP
jgi:hypothetical protein